VNTTAPAAKSYYETVAVDWEGMPIEGAPVRRYETSTARQAAEYAAQATMTRTEWAVVRTTGSGDDVNGGMWRFAPSTGSPVVIRVRLIEPGTDPAPEPAAVVGRHEPLHPVTHPYRHGEVVEYVGPRTRGGLVPGVARYQHLMEPGVAVLRVGEMFHTAEVADLRRPEANVSVELTPTDVARIFQALSVEVERLSDFRAGDPDQVMRHALELRNRFAALHP